MPALLLWWEDRVLERLRRAKVEIRFCLHLVKEWEVGDRVLELAAVQARNLVFAVAVLEVLGVKRLCEEHN